MADITDDFGDKGGLIPFSSVTNLPSQVNESKAVASRELGDIIVKSFENVIEAFEKSDVPVNEKDIERAVTAGINKSEIVKVAGSKTPAAMAQKGLGTIAQKGSASDKAIEDYYKLQIKEFMEKKARREANEAEAEKQKEEQRKEELRRKYEENAERILQEVNKSVSNPLKGFSDALDKGVKKLFVGVQELWNKPVKEVGDDLKKGVGTILSPIATVGKGIGSAVTSGAAIAKVVSSKSTQISTQSVDMDELIQDDEEETTQVVEPEESSSENSEYSQQIVEPEESQTKSEVDELIQDDEEEEKKHDKQANDQKEATENVGKTVGEVVTKAGLVVLALGTLGAFLPVIITKFDKMAENSKYTTAELKASISNLFTGPYSIMKQAELALAGIMQKISFPGFSFNPLSNAERQEYAALEEKQTIAETARSNVVSAAESTVQFTQRGGYTKVQELLESKDLTNEDDIQSAIDALEDPNQRLVRNDMDRRHIINLLKQTKVNAATFSEKKLSEDESLRFQELQALKDEGLTDEYIQNLKDQQEAELKKKKAQNVADVIQNEFDYNMALQRADEGGYGAELRAIVDNETFKKNLSSDLTARQARIVAEEKYEQAVGQTVVNLKNNIVGAGRVSSAVATN